MNADQKSYRQIFKATSLFGGVQVFSILISIIRSKFVAVLLGPSGMGIAGLLISTTGFIYSITNFGLRTSAVKSIAAASATYDDTTASKAVTVLRRLVWFTGIIGMVITAFLSPWLSEVTFGNRDYTIAFIWISVILLFDQLSSGQSVVLQGFRKLNYLARSSVIGLIIGLFITVPIYYIWGVDGIVPVIIITSLTGMVLSWFYARKVGIRDVKISFGETIIIGKEMVILGFLLSLSTIITNLTSYLLRIYISHTGGVDQVGLYAAGFAIIGTYVGMVFSAMGMDYYPRLSAVANDNLRSRDLINQQAEMSILILAPILTAFIVFISWFVILLYSQKFIAINEMIHWAALGMYFKAISWSVAFILLAKGASKLFFWNEVLSILYTLGFNIAGYKLAGLEGLGISFMAAYFVYLIQVATLARIKYSFSFSKAFFTVTGFQFMLGIMSFSIMKLISSPLNYILGSFLLLIATIYSLLELEKRIGLKEIILKYLDNLKNRLK